MATIKATLTEVDVIKIVAGHYGVAPDVVSATVTPGHNGGPLDHSAATFSLTVRLPENRLINNGRG